jgi:hypothetical protein
MPPTPSFSPTPHPSPPPPLPPGPCAPGGPAVQPGGVHMAPGGGARRGAAVRRRHRHPAHPGAPHHISTGHTGEGGWRVWGEGGLWGGVGAGGGGAGGGGGGGGRGGAAGPELEGEGGCSMGRHWEEAHVGCGMSTSMSCPLNVVPRLCSTVDSSRGSGGALSVGTGLQAGASYPLQNLTLTYGDIRRLTPPATSASVTKNTNICELIVSQSHPLTVAAPCPAAPPACSASPPAP